MAFKHKGNGTVYSKLLERKEIMIKQNGSNEWEKAVAYYDPMQPHKVFFTGIERFKDRFKDTHVEYNGDELYDDVFKAVHQTVKESEGDFDIIDITNEVIRKIQPRIETLNVIKKQ